MLNGAEGAREGKFSFAAKSQEKLSQKHIVL